MTKKVLSNLNLNQNQLQNAAIEYLSTAPATPVKGQFYWDSSINALMIYNGTEWQQSLSTADKETIVGLGMPDYSAGVSFSMPYTAPSDGYVNIYTTGTTQQNEIYVNGSKVAHFGGSNTQHNTLFIPLNKGDIVDYKKVAGTGTVTVGFAYFYPMKGVN